MMAAKTDVPKAPPRSAAAEARVVDSQALFGAGKLVYIEHAGYRYVLRVTRENKLILTK